MKSTRNVYAVLITKSDRTQFFASASDGTFFSKSRFSLAVERCKELKDAGIKRCKPVKARVTIETMGWKK